MNHPELALFVKALQARAARISAGPSPTRGQGPGVSAAARFFLKGLDLRNFATSRPLVFNARLDSETQALQESLPTKSRNWGLARKVLNLFLREGLYTTWLANHSGIWKAEHFLELPLDSIIAKELHECVGRGVLPRWPGVKHLDSTISAKYQQAAAQIASGRGFARVHLDVSWWGQRDE